MQRGISYDRDADELRHLWLSADEVEEVETWGDDTVLLLDNPSGMYVGVVVRKAMEKYDLRMLYGLPTP